MTPYWSDRWLDVYQGEATDVLAGLPSASVHAAITSPPYWGLRDYGTAEWSGGDSACDHVERMARGDAGRVSTDDRPGVNPTPVATPIQYRGECRRCGAQRRDLQLGLERSPEEYVERLVAIFREVRRVLRPDGTLWLNLGDSYASGGERARGFDEARTQWTTQSPPPPQGRAPTPSGLKPKDLVGIPWRVAFALQADGWYLRRDVIWSKPNPMPESVTDRPTSSHEYVFLLSPGPRYFYDADAVREPAASSTLARDASSPGTHSGPGQSRKAQSVRADGGSPTLEAAGRNLRSVWTIATAPYPGAHFAAFPPALVRPMILASTSERGVCPECGAPWERVVERVVTESTQRTYRATDAGVLTDHHRGTAERPGGFVGGSAETTGWRPTCAHGDEEGAWEVIATPTGAPRGDRARRMTSGRRGLARDEYADAGGGIRPLFRWEQRAYAGQLRAAPVGRVAMMIEEAGSPDAFAHYVRTDRGGARAIPPELLDAWLERGWLTRPEPPARTELDPIPATVLDPFAGTGTVGQVAQSLSRRAILGDLNADYLRQCLERNRALPLGL